MFCYSISSLTNLKLLNISDIELTETLPDNMFLALLSLEELSMHNCKLKTLPNRCVVILISDSYGFFITLCNQKWLNNLEKIWKIKQN